MLELVTVWSKLCTSLAPTSISPSFAYSHLACSTLRHAQLSELARFSRSALHNPYGSPRHGATSPHLLTLSLEIRDITYEYSAENVRFRYRWSKYELGPVGLDVNGHLNLFLFGDVALRTKVTVQVHNAAPLNVLLTHPRMKEEAEEPRSQLSAEVYVGNIIQACHTESIPTFDPDSSLANDALYHVRHLTIGVGCGSASNVGPDPGHWEFVRQLLDTLGYKIPYITTLRIALRHLSDPGWGLYEPNRASAAFTSGEFFLRPPDTMTGFQLVQRAEGYRLTEWDARFGLHAMTKMGCYTYQVEMEAKQFWKKEDAYEKSFDICGPEPEDSYHPWMREWREKTGHEEAKAWF